MVVRRSSASGRALRRRPGPCNGGACGRGAACLAQLRGSVSIRQRAARLLLLPPAVGLRRQRARARGWRRRRARGGWHRGPRDGADAARSHMRAADERVDLEVEAGVDRQHDAQWLAEQRFADRRRHLELLDELALELALTVGGTVGGDVDAKEAVRVGTYRVEVHDDCRITRVDSVAVVEAHRGDARDGAAGEHERVERRVYHHASFVLHCNLHKHVHRHALAQLDVLRRQCGRVRRRRLGDDRAAVGCAPRHFDAQAEAPDALRDAVRRVCHVAPLRRERRLDSHVLAAHVIVALVHDVGQQERHPPHVADRQQHHRAARRDEVAHEAEVDKAPDARLERVHDWLVLVEEVARLEQHRHAPFVGVEVEARLAALREVAFPVTKPFLLDDLLRLLGIQLGRVRRHAAFVQRVRDDVLKALAVERRAVGVCAVGVVAQQRRHHALAVLGAVVACDADVLDASQVEVERDAAGVERHHVHRAAQRRIEHFFKRVQARRLGLRRATQPKPHGAPRAAAALLDDVAPRRAVGRLQVRRGGDRVGVVVDGHRHADVERQVQVLHDQVLQDVVVQQMLQCRRDDLHDADAVTVDHEVDAAMLAVDKLHEPREELIGVAGELCAAARAWQAVHAAHVLADAVNAGRRREHLDEAQLHGSARDQCS
eukprot:362795-Chlamydomonas_euryale.AAC.5